MYCRSTYANIESLLTSLAREVLHNIPALDSLSVQYLPQVGYLVVVKQEDAHLLPNIQTDAATDHTNASLFSIMNDDEFIFIFQQGGQNYYKNKRMRGNKIIRLILFYVT